MASAPPLTHVLVTAPEGRSTPVCEKDGREPGGAQLVVVAGEIRRVKFSHTTIRSVNRGDLILCNMDGKVVKSFEAASSPKDIDGGKIIIAMKEGKS